MMSRGRLIFISLSLATVSLVVGSSILASTAGRQGDDGEDSLYKYLALFTEVVGLVDRAYVDQTEIEKLMAGAFEGTVDALDPFSVYVPPDQVDAYEAARAVGGRRSGLTVLKERGVAFAMAVEKGSPAELAGIERGDLIARLQGQSTRELPLFRIHSLLAGPVGTRIEVECIHTGMKKDLSFALADFPRPGVELEERRGVPVLRIGAFQAATPDDVRSSLQVLLDDSTLPRFSDKGRLLLDLRSLAGGSEEAAYQVAALFASGELGALATREDVVRTFAVDSEPVWRGRVVALIDRGTQGPAEVLAKVLQQTIDATLVGTYSFGHSGRLSPVRLSTGGRLLITDAFYTGPDREPIRDAIEPDVVVRPEFSLSEEEKSEDEVFDRGVDVLLGKEEVEEKRAA
jgi:carboxyl-terminal processing protease